MTIENRLDRVSIYGSIDLTMDKIGLKHARHLRALLERIVTELEANDLPDRVTVENLEVVDNPFA